MLNAAWTLAIAYNLHLVGAVLMTEQVQGIADLIVFQYDLPPAHLADELQELAVLHLGICVLTQHIS